VNVNVSPNATPAIVRNVAIARATNHRTIEDVADVEIRQGEVLGFSTIPQTGSSPHALRRFFALAGMSLFVASIAVGVFLRQRNRSAEDLLRHLARRAARSSM
jgi:hypothetical protein